jgi:glutamate-5-semialdehyde dehydrogenase
LTRCISEALTKSGLPQASVVVMPNVSHGVVQKLLVRNDIFDLVIPRGGYTLVKDVEEKSTIPVLSHSSGGARIYVDVSADLSMALKIIIDAKTDKPAACNSVDTVLVHQKIAHLLIPKLTEALKEYGVVIKNNRNAQWDREFLDLYINIGEVANVSDAISHIQKYGKGHSECIIAQDKKVIDEFVVGIDVAAVFVNCSPRLHDGGVFGKSMEMGIATGKLHARGPVGLNELTSYKWIAYGNGQIRG